MTITKEQLVTLKVGDIFYMRSGLLLRKCKLTFFFEGNVLAYTILESSLHKDGIEGEVNRFTSATFSTDADWYDRQRIEVLLGI